MAEVELQQIGSYLVTSLLHTTSTGNFYRGKHRKKEILIKKPNVPFSTLDAKEALLLRVKQLKRLKHRHIVNTLDVVFEGDHAYLIMEYVEGEALGGRLRAGEATAADEVKRILSPIAAALHYAHANNALHGNLHPGNIFIGARNEMLLTEFSLPHLLLDPSAIPYMAPEHLHGELTFASDQYALAVIVYELLCGCRPYNATDILILQEQQQGPLASPRTFNQNISPAVERVILRALSYQPDERFAHTQEFADQYLSALMGFPVRPSSQPPIRLPSTPIVPLTPPRREEKIKPPASTPEHAPIESLDHVLQIEAPAAQPFATLTDAALSATPLPHPPGKSTQPEHSISSRNGQATQSTAEIFPSLSRLQTTVTEDLCQGGVLSRSLPGYEERPAQVEMAMVVARSINQNTPALIEASTGTGKSLAYLLPVVRSGKVAIVSTANKALQEQLFYKDIPFIQKHIKHFEAALVKGVNNYICLDRVESERIGMQMFTKNRDFRRLLDMLSEDEGEFKGDFETLGFQLPADVRSRVATDSDQCAWSKCSFFSDCYVRLMRERAEMAQVIVVNHTLLLLDAAIGGFLLPERDLIVLDEAHHLEEEATRSFTITINPSQIQTLLAQRLLRDHSQPKLQDDTLNAAHKMWIRLEQVADPGRKGRINLETPLEEGLHLSTLISDLENSLRKDRPKDMPEKETQLYEKLLKRTHNLAEGLRTVFSVADPHKFVYYVERVEGGTRGGFPLQASAAPLDVTSWLKEKLFDKCNVICTSATLATVGPNPIHPEEKGANFGYFRQRTGLDPVERPEILERILPLTFDYESHALLYLPRDLPAPAYGSGSDDYMKAIAREMYKLVKLSRGRAFLLFSSRRMLDRAYELMSPHLDFPLLKQGEMTRLEMTRRFREEEGSILFGLKSFWEGVDIAGEALSLVVIDKLPFDPPDDPVHEARVKLMKEAGENWFGTYVLPQAVLRLKQGIGRLLRTRDDRGVMAILDTRLHTKGYGKMVLDALPPARRTANLRDVERFFAEDL